MIIIKTIKNIIIIIFLLIISYQTLNNSNEIINSVKFAFDIWKSNVFPSIFPFFIISSFLTNYGFVELTSEVFKPLMQILGIDSKIAYVLIMSMLSGFPSSSKYIKELYEENLIDDKIATKALMFTHFSNPLFLLGTVTDLLGSKKVSMLILIIHYVTNIIIGIIFRNYNNTSNRDKMNIKNAIDNMNKKVSYSKNIGSILSKSIKDAIETLLLILGSITVFSFICVVINHLFNFNNIESAIINGLFEMTQGLKYVSMLSIPLRYKATISTILISFGGLSIHVQVSCILNDTNIKYVPYLLARILHASIAGLLTFILFNII